jgi:hypothetical protein
MFRGLMRKVYGAITAAIVAIYTALPTLLTLRKPMLMSQTLPWKL